MVEPLPIALTQLALWYDPTRIQIWPNFLASLPEGASAKSPTDLGRTFASKRMTSIKHSAAFNLVRNLPGLEVRRGKFQLRGIGFLERFPGGYRVSESGKQLGKSYAASPEGAGWLILLANALLGREPRTRAFFKLLSGQGAALVFEKEGWFNGSYRHARLERTGESDLFPLDSSKQRLTLREQLIDDAWWCLGDWRTDPQLGDATACRYCGTREESFSLHDIGLAIRAACEVLLVAGVLNTSGSIIRINTSAAVDLLPDRALDFGWVREASAQLDLIMMLAEVLPSLRSPTGHIVASELRDLLRTRGVADPDRAIAAAESEGRLLIYAEDYGQSRHGSGLFGDPRKQLVKLRIIGGGDNA